MGGRPIWIGRGRLRSRAEWAVRIPDELAPDETLLSRFSPGRFVELLPLINFLRAVTSDGGWTHPPLMASSTTACIVAGTSTVSVGRSLVSAFSTASGAKRACKVTVAPSCSAGVVWMFSPPT